LKKIGIPDVNADNILPPVIRRKLIARNLASGHGNSSVQNSMTSSGGFGGR
jgi:hypothetical protein